MYQPADVLVDPTKLRDLLGPIFPSQDDKVIDHIDRLCRAWIERCPFVVVSTVDSEGRLDASPKGDPPGFVKVLDEKTLAIPDRPGNRRADGLLNILQTSRIGLMFVVPKRREVVRVNGSAQIVQDKDLLASMAVNQRAPQLAILVRVEEAFFHCGKAMIRSGMWTPETWGGIEGLPSYAEALSDHSSLPVTVEQLQQGVSLNEKHNLY